MDRKPKATISLEDSLKARRLKAYLPSIISSLRVFTLPFLVLSINGGYIFLSYALFVFIAASDFADGYLARRLGVSSKFGANFDAVVDFLFIGGMFLFFAVEGIYPSWVFLLIVFMFAQFKVTSLLSKVVYDPLGKYYGSMLYGAIGLTLFFQGALAQAVIVTSLVGVTTASLTSRILYLIKKNKP